MEAHAATGTDEGVCGCVWCEQERDVDVPDAVQRACERGDLVIFAGAGISTEQRMVSPHPFYAQVFEELELDPTEEWTFPALMSQYEAVFGRRELLQRIKKHLDM